jgi:23S rRNA (uracil1939-C5)-methyltransferase
MTCRHFGICGGCSLPGVPYAGQLRRKHERLRAWFPGVDVRALRPSPREDRFRHKVAFVFGRSPGGRRLAMGHYQAGSRCIVPVEECPVHSDRGNELAFALRDELQRAEVSPAIVRHVLIRTTEQGDEAAVMLVVMRNDRSLRRPIRRFLESAARPTGFFLNIHDRPGPYMVGRETIRLDGRSRVREVVLGTSFLVSPTAFFQTNVGAAAVLLGMVLDRVGAARRILDLYSGAGLFTVPLAARGAAVLAIEENRQAVHDAETNLRLNRVPAAASRLVSGRVEDELPAWVRRSFDVVVIDPPRQGCPSEVIDTLFRRMRPQRVVYVSCNPERLAAERTEIEKAGFALTSVEGVDMFPHTEHIEAVAVFEPATTSRSHRAGGTQFGKPKPG